MHKNVRKKLIFFRHILIEHFDEGELRTLCFDLGVDYDGLPGSGKETKARELIAFLYRRGRIGELITVGQYLRPDVPWPVAGGVRKRSLVIAGILIIALASVAVFEMFRPENQNSIQNATPAPPLSNRVVFVSDRTGNYEIYIASFDSSLPVALTNHPAGDYNPTWSPDGEKIAFVSDRDANGSCDENFCNEIYVMNVDGTHLNRLTYTAADEGVPTWSPDGERIAFQRRVGEDWEIFVMGIDDGKEVNLTRNPSLDAFPTWSPDGQLIAFQSDRDGNIEIYVMQPDGDEQKRLTLHPAEDRGPAWSPDGTQIVFVSKRDANSELYIMNKDGSGQTRLTNTPSIDEWIPTWSPDGQHIAFHTGDSPNRDIFYVNDDGSSRNSLIVDRSDDFWPAWSPLEVTP